MKNRLRRIGIYAGTFDPVHTGHVAFALQAIKQAELDELYFVPERRPIRKEGVEHFAHRVAMLKRATQPYPNMGVIELVDVSFTVKRTLPKLQSMFIGDQLVFLEGSDNVPIMSQWPNIDHLLEVSELVIGIRAGHTLEEMKQIIAGWQVQPLKVIIFDSYAASVSSRRVRDGLRSQQTPEGLLQSVERYSNQHWLYVSLRSS